MRTNTPQADFTAAATLDAPELSADYQQVGLYAYVDDDNYVKADLGWVDGRRALELLAESGGKLGSRMSVPYAGESARLRLVRRGTDVTAEYSSDGQDWYALGSESLGGTPRVALQAAGGKASPPVVATYVEDLTVPQPPHAPSINAECGTGAIGVNLHNAEVRAFYHPEEGNGYYNAINFDPSPAMGAPSPAPESYALLLFSRFAQGTSGLRPVPVTVREPR